MASDAQPRPGNIVRVSEPINSGIDEVAAVLARAMGARRVFFATRRGCMGKAPVGLHIRSTSLWGFLMLRGLVWLHPLRRRSRRYAQEHEILGAWLAVMPQVLTHACGLALVLTGLPRVLKGCGDTQATRGLTYARPSRQRGAGAHGCGDLKAAVTGLREALSATLADLQGKLNTAHRPATAAQPTFWAARPKTHVSLNTGA